MRKILYLTKYIPYPAYGGGLKRNLAWIKFLSKKDKIDVLGFWNKKINKIESIEKKENLNVHYVIHKNNKIKSIIATFFRGGSLINNQYYSIKFIKKLKSLIKNNKYDYVFISEIAMAQYTKYIGNIPFFFDDHNAEFELIERSSKFSKFPMSYILKAESKKIKKEETTILQKSKINFFVSKRDLNLFANTTINKSIVVNNSFDDRLRKNIELNEKPILVFVGNLSWKPNKDGLIHFIEKIYIKLYEKKRDLCFNIIGSCLTSEIKKYDGKYNIKIFENATEETKDNMIDESWITVVPIYFGSGTRIKILEYWSHAKTVVSTSIGSEGLVKSKGTFIHDSDNKQIEMILYLLKNKNKLKEYGYLNYEKFKTIYSEEVIYENTLYKSIFTK